MTDFLENNLKAVNIFADCGKLKSLRIKLLETLY